MSNDSSLQCFKRVAVFQCTWLTNFQFAVVICCCKLNNTQVWDEHLFWQVSTCTRHYQLPIFRCTNVHPQRNARPLFRRAIYWWRHEIQYAHKTIQVISQANYDVNDQLFFIHLSSSFNFTFAKSWGAYHSLAEVIVGKTGVPRGFVSNCQIVWYSNGGLKTGLKKSLFMV